MAIYLKNYLKLQKREKPMTPPKSPDERKVHSVRPFSSITSHIDPMVLYTFLALLIISAVILAFKVSTRVDCSNVSIALSSRQHGEHTSFTVGEVITFTFKTDKAGSRPAGYSWDFGDSSVQQQGPQVYHAFAEAGSYTVTLYAGKCSWRQEVLVVNPAPVNDAPPVADIFPVIEGPDEALVGRPVTYRNNTPGAYSWEWRLLQPNAETHRESSHVYVFSSPGERILTLVVNGDTSRMVKKRIQVFPAPESRSNEPFVPPPFPTPRPDTSLTAPEPEKPRAPDISDEAFRAMLTQLNDKQKTVQDFAPYLCNNLNARVLLNDKEVKTFSEFCNAIRGKKRIKIEMVNLIKDPDGCVKEIRVRYDKKGFLGIF